MAAVPDAAEPLSSQAADLARRVARMVLDETAEEHARELIAYHARPDGSPKAPMRTAMSRIDFGLIRARHGDLDQPVHHGLTALSYDRKTEASLLSHAADLDQLLGDTRLVSIGITFGRQSAIAAVRRLYALDMPSRCTRPISMGGAPMLAIPSLGRVTDLRDSSPEGLLPTALRAGDRHLVSGRNPRR
jgi:hypothetical protein